MGEQRSVFKNNTETIFLTKCTGCRGRRREFKINTYN